MASGTAEHDEARRKDVLNYRKAWIHLQKQAHEQLEPGKSSNYKTSTYDFELQRKENLGLLNGKDPESVDKQRRMTLYNQMKEEYSAKIQNRYSSIDYISQW